VAEPLLDFGDVGLVEEVAVLADSSPPSQPRGHYHLLCENRNKLRHLLKSFGGRAAAHRYSDVP
jgi:hypothetical protein